MTDTWDNCALTNTHIWDPEDAGRVMYCARCDKRAPLKLKDLDMVDAKQRLLLKIPTTLGEVRGIVQELDPESEFGKQMLAIMGKALKDDEPITIHALGETAMVVNETRPATEDDMEFHWNIMRAIQRRWEAENEQLFKETS